MRGVNELHFNQATMIEAVQGYLNESMKLPVPTVKAVTKKSGTPGNVDEFVVLVEGSKGEAP